MLHVFMGALVFRTVLALSGSSWLIVWLGLELNMVIFIPLILARDRIRTRKGAAKYFLGQTIGSIGFVWGVLYNVELVLAVGLIIKIGVGPFHLWYTAVVEDIGWLAVRLLFTWQKLAPLAILVRMEYAFIPMFGVVRALLGSIGGLNQGRLRSLLAYSSVRHTGWVMVTGFYSIPRAITYFGLYMVSFLPLLLLLGTRNIRTIGVLGGLRQFKIVARLLLLRLAGIPPLLGFGPKALVIWTLVGHGAFVMAGLLMVAAVASLAFYANAVALIIVTEIRPTRSWKANWVAASLRVGALIGLPIVVEAGLLW